MCQIGLYDYWTDLGNYVDLVYILGSILMTAVHILTSPYEWYSKYLMSLIVFLAIRRTFNFLRIFKMLSPIVVMLTNVIWQLRIFMTFYFILCILFSLWYSVVGVGNYKLRGKFRDDFNKNQNDQDWDVDPEMAEGTPGMEYEKVGLFVGNIIIVCRISMGDFAIIEPSDYLTPAENYVFWIIWTITCIVTCIIFLNFIVAEAGETYNVVSEELENYIQQQRADLVSEAESLIPNSIKSANKYPKFIVVRKIES